LMLFFVLYSGRILLQKNPTSAVRSLVDFYHKILTSYQKTPFFLYKWRCVRAHTRAQVTLPLLSGPLEGFPIVSGSLAHEKCGKQRDFREQDSDSCLMPFIE
jgi:hypothetical protein